MEISKDGCSFLFQKDKAFVQMNNSYIKGWAETEQEIALNLVMPDVVEADIDYIGPTLALEEFLKVLGLFKWAAGVFGEATVVLVDKGGKLEVVVPEQHGTAAHSTYIKPDTGALPIVGTIHSHPGMGAFWSGTDRKDQLKASGMHLVIGLERGTGLISESLCSLFTLRTQKDYPLQKLVPEYIDQVATEFPEEWKAMFKIEPIPIPREPAGNTPWQHKWTDHKADKWNNEWGNEWHPTWKDRFYDAPYDRAHNAVELADYYALFAGVPELDTKQFEAMQAYALYTEVQVCGIPCCGVYAFKAGEVPYMFAPADIVQALSDLCADGIPVLVNEEQFLSSADTIEDPGVWEDLLALHLLYKIKEVVE